MPEPTNAPEFSVSELSGAIKRTLESAFARVRVRGEITEAKTYPSGHTYFSLKDEGGKIRAVIWKNSAARAGLKPENGVEVIATGRISAYGDRSEYQLIVERLEYAGAGALLARIELLRTRLAAEGLFDPARKRPIPLLPAVVGVITSAKGAVLHDIQTTIARRFARPILLYAVPVQGEGAAEKIASAIAAMDRLPAPGIPRPDVLIVARGGGSLEDLMAFNEEVVLRAAAACRLPLISAVGHETDTTLIDYVSDRRAPTPTAAAEMAIPPRTELLANLAQKAARLAGGLARLTGERRLRFQSAASGLPDLPSLLGHARMRLDDRFARLGMALPNLVVASRAALVGVERHIPDAHALIAQRQAALALLASHHRSALLHALADARMAAARIMPRLSAAPVEAVLRERRTRLERLTPDAHAIIAQRQAALAALAVRHRSAMLHALTQGRMAAAHTLPRLSAAPVKAALRERRAQLERHIPDAHAIIAQRQAGLAVVAARHRIAMLHALTQGRMAAARILPRLSAAPVDGALRERRARLEGLSARLDGASYEAVLARGFALVRDGAGRAVYRAAEVRPSARLAVRFADGEVGVRAEAVAGQGALSL